MKAIGFQCGQFGDLVISSVAARAFKQVNPKAHLTIGISQKYKQIAPLFENHKYFDDIVFYEGYDNWPAPSDLETIKRFDMVYDAMPKRLNEADWWKSEHQAVNACSIYCLSPPNDLQCSLNQSLSYSPQSKTITFAPFAGFYNSNNLKKLSISKAQQIVNALIANGYEVFVVGGPNEPDLQGAVKINKSYSESLKFVLGCQCYIGTDTGMTWAASAYSVPTIGLYSHSYYGSEYVKNIQPINPNAIYLSENNVNDIKIEDIIDKLSLC